MIGIVTPRRRLQALLDFANKFDETAFVTIDNKREVLHGRGHVAK
jgi:hypothetical protein